MKSHRRTPKISGIFVLILCFFPAAPGVAQDEARRLRAEDLAYQGAFAFPPGEEWAYSGQALAYRPGGDPSGAADGHPGSLYAAGNATQDLVGEISIPEPVATRDFAALPRASVLRPLADVTGGWIGNCTYDEECVYREVDGLEYLPQTDKVIWNLRDWYNATASDQDSLGWSEADLTGARGVWHIGPRGDEAFHNAKTCNYLFTAPADFASEHLDGKRLVAGNHREGGALGGSQGPTLYALAPWEDGSPPASGQDLDAVPLLYYREFYECVWEENGDIKANPEPGVCDFPDYRAVDRWEGGAWARTASRSAVLIFGRKALGDNCYGEQEECSGDPCSIYRGYHGYPYEPRILFYDPQDLQNVLAGTRNPWEVLPYETYRPTSEVFDAQCGVLAAATWDEERGLIYVAEQEAGPDGETAVHVWQVREDNGGREVLTVDSDDPRVTASYSPGQRVHIFCKAAQGRTLWVFVEAPRILPGARMARPSDEYCRTHGNRYLFPFSEGDEELYYAASYGESKIDFGENDLTGLGELVVTVAQGDSSRSLETVQVVRLVEE